MFPEKYYPLCRPEERTEYEHCNKEEFFDACHNSQESRSLEKKPHHIKPNQSPTVCAISAE